MRTLNITLFSLMAGSTLLSQPLMAQDYATNYPNNEVSTHATRYLRSIAISADDLEAQTINVSTQSGYTLYQVKLDEVVTVKAGAKLNVASDYNGSWMNAYAYIDEGNDGSFSFDVDDATHKPAAGSDLKSFSFYSFNSSSDNSGYDSEGSAVTGDNRSTLTLPSFTAPTTPGEYRMRVKIDWNNIDPAGATTASPWGSMQKNGGVIVDFTLKVEADDTETPVTPPEVEGIATPYTIDFTDSQEGWTAVDESTTPGKTWAYNEKGFYYMGRYIPCVTLESDNSSEVNDYYVSPAFALKAGTYDLKTFALSDGNGETCDLLYGTSATDMSGFQTIGELNVPDNPNSSDAEQAHTLTIAEDGIYYFAFHAKKDLYTPGNIYLFNFEVEKQAEEVVTPPEVEGIATPYDIDFSASQEGWTAVDESPTPGKTWEYKEKGFYYMGQYAACVHLQGDYSSDVNDYYVSPAFALQPGTYTLKTFALSDDNGETCDLLYGTSATDMSGFQTISALNVPDSPNSSDAEQTHTLTITEAGTYYFAFHAKKGQYTPGDIYLFNFEIKGENDGGGDVTPPEVEAPTAEMPYAINFKLHTTDWNKTDNNQDGQTWQFYYNVGMAVEIGTNDDALVSPLFELEEGKTYKVTTSVEGAGVNPATVLSLGVGETAPTTTIAATLGMPSYGSLTESHTFKATASGKQHFYLTLKTEEYNTTDAPFFVTAFAVEEVQEGGEVNPGGSAEGDAVYTADFSDTSAAWSITDINNDGTTWEQTPTGISYDGTTAAGKASDVAISPSFTLKADQDYVVRFSFEQSNAFDPDEVEVLWGTPIDGKVTPVSLGELSIYAPDGMGVVSDSLRLASDKDALAYIGFMLRTPDANGVLTLKALSVTPIDKAFPLAATELQAAQDPSTKEVTIGWTTPTHDTSGLRINQPLTVKVYEGDILLTTLTEQATGAAGSYSYTPAGVGGEVTYKVVTCIGDNDGAATTTSINLDDAQGKEELVMAFDVNRESSADWAIENLAGTSEWGYDYSNVFRFSYKMGQKDDSDWLISPAVSLETGNRYVASYELSGTLSYASNVDVTIGDEQTSAAQSQVIASHPQFTQNGFGEFRSKQFTVTKSGDYYIGFHVTKANYSVSMRNLAIYHVTNDLTGIDQLQRIETIAFNRTTQELVVPTGAQSVRIYDAQGRLMKQVGATAGSIQLQQLPQGIYCIQCVNAEGKLSTFKITK